MKYGSLYWDAFEQRERETIAALSVGKRPSLRRISVHLSSRCNLACKYCNERHRPRDVDTKALGNLLEDYNQMGGGIVHFTGGEPTLHPDFDDIMAHASELANLSVHLNTNLYEALSPAVRNAIKRLKVSLDTAQPARFNDLTGKDDAFRRVTTNLDTIGGSDITVSITYVISRATYRDLPDFLRMYYQRWNFYAVFLSSYKGQSPDYAMTDADVTAFFEVILPEAFAIMDENQDNESRFLFETAHSRATFAQHIRFPRNATLPCYISLSELCIDETGGIWNCSHLYRDKVSPISGLHISQPLDDILAIAKRDIPTYANPNCLYGCNGKLVCFNQDVHDKLAETQ